VLIAHGRQKGSRPDDLAGKASEYGLKTTTRFSLDRHIPPLGTLQDVWRLPRFIRRENFDIVHMHLSHDPVVGGPLLRLLDRKRPVLVRTLHRRDVLKKTSGTVSQIRRLADGYVTFTERFRDLYIKRFGLEPQRVVVQPLSVDLERFNPDRSFRDMRHTLDIDPEAPVIGTVGHWQPYRAAGVFLEAAAKVIKVEPVTRFVILGRSRQMPETVVSPMKRLGISKYVRLLGYRLDDYDDILASLNIFSLLMPGADGTARAVREAMALGKPCVVSDFGMLPEIVPHGKVGLVVSFDSDALSQAWLTLIRNRALRHRLAANAREHAHAQFRIARVGECLEGFYGHLLKMRLKRLA